jgi:cell division protein FtsW (lipid II flippase)
VAFPKPSANAAMPTAPWGGFVGGEPVPIIGTPLPHISYGGTAVLTDFAAIGFLRSVSFDRANGLE